MNHKSPCTFLVYGFPNICRPMVFHHLTSFVMGDFFRRILQFGDYAVVSDLQINDLGKQVGFVSYAIQHTSKEKVFASIKGVHDAFFFAKKLAQNDDTIMDDCLRETLLWQNDPNYMAEERENITQLFLAYLKQFMEDIHVSADLWHWESQYLRTLRHHLPPWLEHGIATIQNGFMTMGSSSNRTHQPLMLQHQDGRYLYAAIDLGAIVDRLGSVAADKMLYIMTGKQSTQSAQVFDAASQVGVSCHLEHVKLSTIVPVGPNTPKNPTSLIKKLATWPCPDMVFESPIHQKNFLISVLKLKILWHNPRYEISLDLDTLHHDECYLFLKQFARDRKHYRQYIDRGDSSPDVTSMVTEVHQTNTLIPVVRLLKKCDTREAELNWSSNAFNTIASVLHILGLDRWDADVRQTL